MTVMPNLAIIISPLGEELNNGCCDVMTIIDNKNSVYSDNIMVLYYNYDSYNNIIAIVSGPFIIKDERCIVR